MGVSKATFLSKKRHVCCTQVKQKWFKLQIIPALQQTNPGPNVVLLHSCPFTWSILQLLITQLQVKSSTVIPLQATSYKTPQNSIKYETFLVSPISIVLDFLFRRNERVTGRQSVHTRLAWLRKKKRYVIVVIVWLKRTYF